MRADRVVADSPSVVRLLRDADGLKGLSNRLVLRKQRLLFA